MRLTTRKTRKKILKLVPNKKFILARLMRLRRKSKKAMKMKSKI